VIAQSIFTNLLFISSTFGIVTLFHAVLQHEKDFESQLGIGESIFVFTTNFCEKLLNYQVEVDDDDLQDYLVSVIQLIRIFSRTDDFALKMGDLGALKLIIRGMEKMPFSIPLQINCSACLANMASVGITI
jgi:hypothetical protein